LPASGATAASTAAAITTTGVSTAVDAASGLIVVFPAAASVSDAIADSSSLAVHARKSYTKMKNTNSNVKNQGRK
jgi:hypothetical protein